MKWKTKSARDWDDWLRATGTSRAVAAAALSISLDTVTKLRSTSRPGWDLAERMRDFTSDAVSVGGWAETYGPTTAPAPAAEAAP